MMRTGGKHLMCTEICDGAGTGICDGPPSTCSSFHYNTVYVIEYCQVLSGSVVCLCLSFTAQSTDWDHVMCSSLPNHTFTGPAESSKW